MPFFASPEITDSDEERKWRQKQKEPDQSRRQKRRGLQEKVCSQAEMIFSWRFIADSERLERDYGLICFTVTVSSQRQKDKKPKKSTLRFHLDLTHPLEDGIFDSGNFEQFLSEKVKVNGKTENLGNVVHNEDLNKITVVSEKQFSKRYLKYLTRKYLKKNNLHA
ncbi:60S ribosomal protein L22-like 1-like protein [Cricetulus griseus]|nr:60S ribosomal protein L22-like 1-like protein [Cricetulus griseus]